MGSLAVPRQDSPAIADALCASGRCHGLIRAKSPPAVSAAPGNGIAPLFSSQTPAGIHSTPACELAND